jgi:glycosyltransferase involved in cell wall biosynthesis
MITSENLEKNSGFEKPVKSCLYVQRNNDYTGSTAAIAAIIGSHELEDLIVASDFAADGFLKVDTYQRRIDIRYRFKGKGIGTILELIKYSIVSFFKTASSKRARRVDCFYINTISPWSVAILGKLLGKRVVYHIHEFYENPSLLVKFFIRILLYASDENIFVSDYTKQRYFSFHHKFKSIPHKVQFTPVRFKILKLKDLDFSKKFKGPVVMACSPRRYKGVEVFSQLASLNPSRKFVLFLSDKLCFRCEFPPNVEIKIKSNAIEQHFREASMSLNLSQQPDWIETFGLTIWEAMTQATPVIVPDVGGPLEIIDGNSGVSCDTREVGVVDEALKRVLSDLDTYIRFSRGALARSKKLMNLNKIDL